MVFVSCLLFLQSTNISASVQQSFTGKQGIKTSLLKDKVIGYTSTRYVRLIVSITTLYAWTIQNNFQVIKYLKGGFFKTWVSFPSAVSPPLFCYINYSNEKKLCRAVSVLFCFDGVGLLPADLLSREPKTMQPIPRLKRVEDRKRVIVRDSPCSRTE